MTNLPVIVKKVFKSEENYRAIQQIKSEAQFSFSSPFLQSSLALIEKPTCFYLVKEYFEGIPLLKHWETLKRKNKLNCLKDFVYQTLPVFDALKKANVVHADIKPSNLIVTQDKKGAIETVKLIDFGLSFYTDNIPNRQTLFPLGFSAPELILNRLKLVNHATDLYAFGIVLFYLLEGHIPNLNANPTIATNLQITVSLPELQWRYRQVYPLLERLTHKANFKIPPNRLDSQKVDLILSEAMSRRFQSLDAFYLELIAVGEKKWF